MEVVNENAPVTVPTEPVAAAPAVEGEDWAALSNDDDSITEAPAASNGPAEVIEEVDDSGVPVVPAAEAPVEPAAPAEAVIPAEPAPVIPAVVPEAVAPVPAQEAPVPATPVSEAPAWEKVREEAKASLQKAYAFDEQTARDFEANPAEVLPKIAAELHMSVFDAVYRTIVAEMPRMMEMQTIRAKAASSFDTKFFERWPALKDKREDVRSIMNTYAQVNPGIGEEQFIEDVGLQASVKFRLPIQAKAAAAPVPAPVPSGFRPAAPGASPMPKPTLPSGEQVWVEMIEDDDS